MKFWRLFDYPIDIYKLFVFVVFFCKLHWNNLKIICRMDRYTMSFQAERERLFLQQQKKQSNTSSICPYTLYLHSVISKQSEVEIKNNWIFMYTSLGIEVIMILIRWFDERYRILDAQP